jgi:hypothetical protein
MIFLCTGLFALTLIVLFFRSQNGSVTRTITRSSDDTTVNELADKKILEKINKSYKFRSSQQDDIFGAFIFNFPVEIRVADRVRVYIFENDYTLIKRNLMLLSPVYNFQDTTDFFGKTLFLNDKTGDTQIVRFITEIDGTTV